MLLSVPHLPWTFDDYELTTTVQSISTFRMLSTSRCYY